MAYFQYKVQHNKTILYTSWGDSFNPCDMIAPTIISLQRGAKNMQKNFIHIKRITRESHNWLDYKNYEEDVNKRPERKYFTYIGLVEATFKTTDPKYQIPYVYLGQVGGAH